MPSQKKINYAKQLNELLDTYDKIMIVGCDNVRSRQMQNIRIALRGKAVLLMGKNTLVKKIMTDRAASSGNDRDKQIVAKLVADELLVGNVGLIFTNGDLQKIKETVEKERVQAPAKAGALAPVDVTVPAGNTGLEPTKTSFFQALSIATKITKGTVEIIKDEKVVTAGQKVGSSEATLLQMLGINPFFYGLIIQYIWDQGSVYSAEVLNLTQEDKINRFREGIANVAAVSLALGWTTKASFPHVVVNAFKDILSVSVGTNYDFDEFNGKQLKESILRGPVAAAPSQSSAAAGGSAAAAAPKKEEAEESDEEMGFGLFD
jgi:large subunit ribosomal protein LP0